MSKRSFNSNDDASSRKVAKSQPDFTDNAEEVFVSVLLCADGSRKEIKTSLSDATQFLGEDFAFHGGWADNNTIMLVSDDQENEDLDINKNKLQPPFHNHEIRGDILVMKTDDNGNRTDFTLQEYEQFLSLEIEEWELDEDEEDGESGDEENQDDGGEAALYDSIISSVTEDCVAELARDLTDEENQLIAQLIDNISETLRNFDAEDENTDIRKIIDDISKDLKPWFEQTYSRSPTDDEDIIIFTTVNRVIMSATEEETADPELVDRMYTQLVDTFRYENARSPTNEEVEDIRQQCEALLNGDVEIEDDEGDEFQEGEYDEQAGDDEDEEAEEDDE